ncbi:hypothetical protein GCM10020331_059040 [Ectobacillus funiculus]
MLDAKKEKNYREILENNLKVLLNLELYSLQQSTSLTTGAFYFALTWSASW